MIPIKNANPSYFLLYPIRSNLHPAKGEPFLAQVLQRDADMIHRIVNAMEAINLTAKQG